MSMATFRLLELLGPLQYLALRADLCVLQLRQHVVVALSIMRAEDLTRLRKRGEEFSQDLVIPRYPTFDPHINWLFCRSLG
jgi:hypothetical protein